MKLLKCGKIIRATAAVICLAVLFLSFPAPLSCIKLSAATMNNGMSAETLAGKLAGGLEVSNALGYGNVSYVTDAMDVLGIDEGVVLDTAGGSYLGKSQIDPDLQEIIVDKYGKEISGNGDMACITFDMTATGSLLVFNYVFASREFDQDSKYNDIFGLFVSINGGPFENIAKLDNGKEVTITTLRAGKDGTQLNGGEPISYVSAGTQYDYFKVTDTYLFSDYGSQDREINGVSNLFTAQKRVEEGDNVTLKFVISDVGDTAYHSYVIIEANSINFLDVNVDYLDETLASLMPNGNYVITANGIDYYLTADSHGEIPITGTDDNDKDYDFSGDDLSIVQIGSNGHEISEREELSVDARPIVEDPKPQNESPSGELSLDGQYLVVTPKPHQVYSTDGGATWLAPDPDGKIRILLGYDDDDSVRIVTKKSATETSLSSELSNEVLIKRKDLYNTFTGISAPNVEIVYDGEDHIPIADIGVDDVEITYSLLSDSGYAESIKLKNAGTFTVYFCVTKDGYSPYYSSFEYKIKKAKVEIPAKDNGTYVFNGNEHTYIIASNSNYTVTNNKRTDAGYQEVTVTLKDTDNYEWTDGTTAPKAYDFNVGKAPITAPVLSNKVFNNQIQKADVPENTLYTVAENSGGKNVGKYGVVLELTDSDNYKWSNTESESTTVYFDITVGENIWTVTPNIEGWIYGNPNEPLGSSKYGTPVFSYFDSNKNPLSEKPANVGNYYMKASVSADDDNYASISTDFIPFSIDKADPQVNWPEGLEGNEKDKLSTVVLPDGFEWEDGEQILIYGDDLYSVIYTPEDTDNYKTLKNNVFVKGLDITDPKAEVTVDTDKSWSALQNEVVFDIFFKDSVNVSVTVSDIGSGVLNIYCYISADKMSLEELKALENGQWTVYTDGFKITEEGEHIVYVKASDKSGNTAYISSNGFVVDKTNPNIGEIRNEEKLYGDAVFTAQDKYIDSVLVDGKPVEIDHESNYIIPADNTQHTVKVTDKSGNVTEYVVTVYKIYTVTYMAGGKEVSVQQVGHGKDALSPEIPGIHGYTASWDSDGKNIVSDTVIVAEYLKNPQMNDFGMSIHISVIVLCISCISAAVIKKRRKT